MSILRELTAITPKTEEVTEERVERYNDLLESIEDLYEKWSLFGKKKDDAPSGPQVDPRKKLQMARIHTVRLSADDKSFHLKDDVFGIRNEDPIVDFLVDILGVPKDGSPIRIRTGFMQYDERSKMLFLARFKSDLPAPMGTYPKKEAPAEDE